jgi:hypothetical protein
MILIVGQIFQVVLATVCVVEGVRWIILTGLSAQKMYVVILGIVICFGNATMSYLDYRFQSRGLSLMSKKLAVPQLGKEWGTNFSPEHKSHVSREVARAVFERNGELRNYFNPEGSYLVFSPTQVEIEARENSILQLSKLEKIASDSWSAFVSWLLLLVFSFVFGGTLGLMSKHKTLNFSAK